LSIIRCDYCGAGFARADALKKHVLAEEREARKRVAAAIAGSAILSEDGGDIDEFVSS
jgi:hypothetical protein